jgi:hypothetical protein
MVLKQADVLFVLLVDRLSSGRYSNVIRHTFQSVSYINDLNIPSPSLWLR